MPKLKVCSFCNKEVEKLWYSNPKCCHSFECRKLYNESKPKKGTDTSQQKKSYKIKPFADKRIEQLKEYRIKRDAYLLEHPFCEIRSPKCTGKTTELHHKKPRRFYLCDVSVFCASCRSCNTYVESNHQWAREKGFKIDHL